MSISTRAQSDEISKALKKCSSLAETANQFYSGDKVGQAAEPARTWPRAIANGTKHLNG